MWRRWTVVAAVLTLGLGVLSAAEVDPLSADPTPADYKQYAALHNPGLEAAFNRWKAAVERVPQVTALPDPRFTFRYYIEEVETRVGPQDWSVSVGQMFPWFGTLRLRGNMAAEAADAEWARYEAAKLKLFHQVVTAYYEYYYVGRALATVQAMRDLMGYLEEVARARYRVGSASYADMIRAQVELGKLEDRIRTLEDLHGPLTARLNAVLNRPVDTPIPPPVPQPSAQLDCGDDQVLAWLAESSPELTALDHEAARQSQGKALAGKAFYPDLTVGLTYIDTGSALMPGTPDNGKDPVIASVSVNVPLWHGKYDAGRREARARYRAALKGRADRENLLTAAAKLVLHKVRDAERKTDLYRDTLMPKAEQALTATQTAYQAGKASFLDLIDATRVLLEFQLAHERALADHAERLAELEMLVGRKVPCRSAEVPREVAAP